MSLRPFAMKSLRAIDDDDAARADVLLRARVDERELRDVDLPPEEVARHVGDERAPRLSGTAARDRRRTATPWMVSLLVRCRYAARGVAFDLRRLRHAHVALLLAVAAPGRAGDAGVGACERGDDLRLGERLLAPRAGHDVVGAAALGEEVHRDLREQLRRATLEEEHLVRRGHGEELAQERDRLVVDRLVLLAAVAVLHHGHAGAGEVQELVAGALEGGEREGRRGRR